MSARGREAVVLSGVASGMCDRIPGAVTGAASARVGHGLDSRFLQERLPPRGLCLGPSPAFAGEGARARGFRCSCKCRCKSTGAGKRGLIPNCRATLHPDPQPPAPVTTPADRRALTASLPPLQDADARAIEAFIDAIWAESGLARQTLDSYRRDLEGYARW